MAQTAYALILRAQSALSDTVGDQWSQEDLLSELNAGQALIVQRVPSAYTVTRVVTLASGGRQSLPSDACRLVTPGRNVNTDDSFGPVIFAMDLDSLLFASPNWENEVNPASTIYGVMYSQTVPREFWVYPPAVSGARIELKFSSIPSQILYDEAGLWQTALLSISSEYVEALFEWLLYRAYARNVEVSANAQNAALHKSVFDMATGAAQAGGE